MIKQLNIKTKLLVVLVILSLVSVVYIVFSSNKNVITNQKQSVSPPKLQNYFGNTLKINQTLISDDFSNFPKNLPYLKQNRLNPFTATEMNSISNNFGFTIKPTEATDVNSGKFYIWNNDKYSLIIYSDIRKIEITPSYNPVPKMATILNKQISDDGYKNLAVNLVSEKLNINKDSLKFSNFIYLKTEKGLEGYRQTTREDSEIIQVNLYSSEGVFPIFTLIPQDSQIFVQFTKDGELLNMKASLFSEYKKGETEYKIKSYNEVLETINESVLVSLNDSNVNLPDLKSEDVGNININKVSLVYLQDNLTSEILQPVFLLEGTASVKGFAQEVTASLYLPAYSKK